MITVQLRVLPVWVVVILMLMLAGCGSPTPATQNAGPPPPPPAPAPEPEPAPPPKPDPYETVMSEVSTILRRYGTVYANVKDEPTADKAVEEIGRMTSRLRALSAEIGKMPYRAGQEKHALAFQTELTQLQTAQLSNTDMQRVLGDPDLGLKFIAAHQSFVTEGLLPLGQTIVARQPNVSQQPSAATQSSPPPK
jgi:hypothetical protein